MHTDYWKRRQDTLYYNVVRVLTSGLSKKAASMLDVGSGGCPYLDWYPHIARRVSLDADIPYEAAGIESVRENFLAWDTSDQFDIVTCLQVLEHVRKPDVAARKLMRLAPVVVVSVPYRWPAGQTEGHVNDPVDEEKMASWFGREPNFSYICREVTASRERLICVYERQGRPWKSLEERRVLRKG